MSLHDADGIRFAIREGGRVRHRHRLGVGRIETTFVVSLPVWIAEPGAMLLKSTLLDLQRYSSWGLDGADCVSPNGPAEII